MPPRRTSLPVPHTRVEYLILADRVEALNGKLYMMGGGWDRITIQDLDQPATLSIACGVVVPYNETDDDHRLTLAIRTADGEAIAPPFNIEFRTGRAPTLNRGADTHIPFAIGAAFVFPGAGDFSVLASMDDRADEARRLAFSVHTDPMAGGGPVAR